jgi:superfamily II DNA or RNA helicase
LAGSQKTRPSLGAGSSIYDEFHDHRLTEVSSPGKSPQTEISLWPHQALGIVRLRKLFRAGASRVLFQLATGGGKTVLFCYIARSALSRGKRTLIIVHRQEILEQVSAALSSMGVQHGFIAPDAPQTDEAVQVAMVATLVGRVAVTKYNFQLVVVDECHHAVSPQWRRALDAFPDADFLHVTATPQRLDGKPLDTCEAMICGPSVAALTASKHLVPAIVYTPARLPDLSGIRTRAGDFAIDQLSAVMSDQALIDCAVQDYAHRCPGSPAIVFAVDRRHSEQIKTAFTAAGFRAAHVDGETPHGERRRLIRGLGSEIEVLCNCNLLGEGVDVPVLAAAILLRPTQSLVLHQQQIGRVLRSSPGKDRAIVLDHAGNVLKHGLPDEPHRWSLQGIPRSKQSRRYDLRRCEACSAVNRPGPFCAICAAPPRPAAADSLELWRELTSTPGLATELRRMSYSQVVAWSDTPARAKIVEMARGFKPGWAWHRARELEARTTA